MGPPWSQAKGFVCSARGMVFLQSRGFSHSTSASRRRANCSSNFLIFCMAISSGFGSGSDGPNTTAAAFSVFLFGRLEEAEAVVVAEEEEDFFLAVVLPEFEL